MRDDLSTIEPSKDEILFIEESFKDLIQRIFSGFENKKDYHVVDTQMNKYLDEIEESI